MKRSHRASQAQETVAICEAGKYVAPDGREVSIKAALSEAIAGTALSEPATLSQLSPPMGGKSPIIEVTAESTIAAARRLAAVPGGHLACLDFASAKNPGGGFLGGAEAQEESLARASGLYPCLLAAPAYYERNRGGHSSLYLDLAIWSPGVPFFRDDEGALLPEPFRASVITSPAPNAGAVGHNEPARLAEVAPTLQRRAALVLGLAAAQGVKRLVLGAWGCGVFRNDPHMVAEILGEGLSGPQGFGQAFDEVIFAIYDSSPNRTVLRAFEEALA